MKIIKRTLGKNNKWSCVVELDDGEVLMAVYKDAHYRLGYPLQDDVVRTDHIQNIEQVEWCVIEQKWVA